MSGKINLKGIVRARGHTAGKALVSEQTLSCKPFSILNEAFLIIQFKHKLNDQNIKDKIVIYPRTNESKTVSMVLYFNAKDSHFGPKAIVCDNCHPKGTGVAIGEGILGIDGLDLDLIKEIQTGDWVEIHASEVGKEATITITPKA